MFASSVRESPVCTHHIACQAPLVRRALPPHALRHASSSVRRGPAPQTKAYLDQAKSANSLEHAEESSRRNVESRRQARHGAPMQWHLRFERDRDGGARTAGSYRTGRSRDRDFPMTPDTERVQHVPFEGVELQEPARGEQDGNVSKESPQETSIDDLVDTEAKRTSTMTDRERRAFQRLFGSRSAGPSSSRASRLADPATAIDDIDPSVPDTSSFFDRVSYDARLTRPMNIASFPAEIRAMAAQAQRDSDRRKRRLAITEAAKAEEESWEPVVRGVEQELHQAQTDLDVWTVIQRRVFDPLKKLDAEIKSGTNRDGATNGSMLNEGKASSPEPNPIAMGCSTLFATAMKLLARRTTYSQYTDALLPAIKSHCWTTSVLGISTPLYNELLSHTWRVHQDLSNVSQLLQEMDAAALEPDDATLSTLDNICTWLLRARSGQYGLGAQVVEGLLERRKDADEVQQRRDEIKNRLNQMAVRLSQRQEQERRLGMEGAFEDSDDSLVDPLFGEPSRAPDAYEPLPRLSQP